MTIVALTTGLFPDEATVAAALARLEGTRPVVRIDLTREDLDDAAWDAALSAILAADLAFTC
jgi:hypothetical protein